MTNPTWRQIDKGRFHLQMNGHDLQVIRNPDREDRRRFLAVVNRRPLDPPTQTVSQAKTKAMNFVFGFNRKPRGSAWDWSQVRPVKELEAELDAKRQAIPGTGPQPEAQPGPQPEAQEIPDLTDDQANRIMDAIFQEIPEDPQPEALALAPPDQVGPLGTVHEVHVEFKATFRTADPDQVVNQLKVYIQSLRQDLGGDVDCKVNQPPVIRI